MTDSGSHFSTKAIRRFLAALITTLAPLTLMSADALAQPANTANYVFTTATNASLTDMSTGTTQLLAANIDDTASAQNSIGFDFFFMGTRFATFSVNDNGVLRLGATAQTSTPYKPLAQASLPIITAYGADQRTHAGDGRVHFKVIGSAPSRTLVVEWLNNQSNFNTGGTADLTYQVRLYETTGVIEFVYGSMTMSTLGAADTNSRDPHIGFSSGNVANTVGSVTAPQSGAPAPSYDGTSNNPVENLYAAGAIPVLTSAAQGSRRIFTFTPPTPTAPTNLTFTAVGQLDMTLNWIDSANETIYSIYRSTDGINFTFFSTAALNATSFVATSLDPGTLYFWNVYAVSEGALSTALTGSQMTNAAGAISSVTSGLWSVAATWGGAVPGAGDNVTIANGHTVTIDVPPTVALNLTVANGGILEFEATTARTLTVGQSVIVATGGTFRSAATGTQTGHVLSVGRDLTNNGTIDFSTNGDTAGAGITFTGTLNNTFTLGGASATDFKQTAGVTINKGTNNTPVLSFLPGGTLTVLGANAVGFLQITNGTFRIDGTNAFSNPLFNAAAYSIPATGGFHLNNSNANIVGLNGSPTLTGLLRVSTGTLNIGNSNGNSMGFAAGSNILIEGGAVNATGRFGVAASGNAITYNQTAGVITVCTIGHSSTTLASFDLGTGVGTVNITGGTIINQLANTAVSGPRDYRNQQGLTGTTTVTGGTVQLGNAASGAAKAFSIAGVLPNLVISNTSANHSATFLAPAVFNNITRDVTINTGTTLNIGNNVYLMNGTTFTNNGTLTANGGSTNFVWFQTAAPITYTGTGVVTAPMTNMAIQADSGLIFDPAVTNNIVVGAVRLFSGSVTNSNKITLGNGGATTGVLQIGNTTTPTAAGTFDQPFVFNLGTGGQTASYLRTTTSRSTGPEINPARVLTSMTRDDNDVTHTLTIAGGDLMLSSTGTALALTNGRIVTGTNTIILTSGTAAVTRTTGLVDGNLRKTYAAAANKSFEVGTANGFSPVAVNVTAGTFPALFTVSATQGPLPVFSNPEFALQRYWTLTGTGITADLTFTYLDPTDIPGTATEVDFVTFKFDGGFTQFPGTVNAAGNQATVTGVTSFSDWTVAEPEAAGNGTPVATATPTATTTTTATPAQPTSTSTVTATPMATATVTNTPADTHTPTVTPTPTITNTPDGATETPTATTTPTTTTTPTATCPPFTEGFNNITTLPSGGWAFASLSDPNGPRTWFQGNSGNFPAQAGDPNSYISADFGAGAGVATLSEWMMLPATTLSDGDTLRFWTRTSTANPFPDRLQVRRSTNGASTDVGATATSVGDFSTVLLDINPTYVVGGYPEVWTEFTITLSGIGSPTLGRIAFRYFVEDGGPGGNNSLRIGIDTVTFTAGTCPTPTPTATPTITPTTTSTETPVTGTPTETRTPTDTRTPTITATATATPTTACPFGEGFEQINNLVPNGWAMASLSDPNGPLTWFQGVPSVFPAHAGDPNDYIAVNFQAGAGVATLSEWLMLPALTLRDGDTLRFWTRVPGSNFPDRMQVRLSTNGTSTDVGATATSVGDFTTVLLEINPNLVVGGYPTVWTEFTVTLSGLGSPTLGRLAFRYFVTNGGPGGANSDYVGLDSLTFTSVTCPTATPTQTATATPTITHTATITPTPTPMFFVQDVSQNEGQSGITTFTFRVALVPRQSVPMTVDFETQPDTASAPDDFEMVSGTLTFDPDTVVQSFDVSVVGETFGEANERFLVVLSNPSAGAIVGGDASGVIVNDDGVITDTHTPTASPTITETETPVPTSTDTPTETPTNTATPTATPGCVTFTFGLSGAEEVPANSSAGTGSGTIQVNAVTNRLDYNVSFSGLGSAETMAHIHGFAAIGVNAPIRFNLPLGSPKIGFVTFDEAQQADILGGLSYVNVHSVNLGGGEIRGQVDQGVPGQCAPPFSTVTPTATPTRTPAPTISSTRGATPWVLCLLILAAGLAVATRRRERRQT